MAVYTVSNTGGDINVGATYVGGVAPTSADTIDFTATSGQLTVNTNFTISGIDFTNYVNTLTFSANLTVAGNITLASGMSFAGTATLGFICNVTATLTSNGVTFPNNLSILGSAVTYTFADAWTVYSLTSANAHVINGSSISITTTLTNSQNMTGTTVINLTGSTVTWTGGGLVPNLVINTAGTVTVSGTVAAYVITHTAGSVTTTGSTLSCSNSNVSWDTSAITWNNVTLGAGTITLTSALNLTGTLNIGAANSVTLNGSNVNVGGNLSLTGSGASIIAGTSTIVLNGTGTWSHSFTSPIRCNLTINTAGTITVSGAVYFGSATLTYTAGSMTVTGSTLNVPTTATLATNGMSWNAITFSGTSQTYTLTNNLTANGTVTFAGATAQTINGSTLICLGNLTSTSAAVYVTGTTNISMQGTSSIVGSNGGYALNIDINTAGTITFTSTIYWKSGTFSYTAGTVVTTGSTLTISGTGGTLNTNGMEWNNINASTGVTITLTSNLTYLGTFNVTSGSVIINGFTMYCKGSLTIASAGGNAVSGTTNIEFTGNASGTWMSNTTNNVWKNNVTINKSGGTLTIGSMLAYNTGTLTHVAGTVDALTNSNTLYIASNSTTFDTNGITWNNITCTTTGGLVITLTSAWNINGTATFGNASQPMTINGANVNVSGILTSATNQANPVSGTSTIRMVGASCSIVDNSSIGTPTVSMAWVIPIVIDTVGTCTITGRFSLGNGGSITHILGSVSFTSSASNTSYLTVVNNGTVTINTGSVVWNEFKVLFSGTFNINSTFNATTISVTHSLNNAVFAGTSGFICSTFTSSGASTFGRVIVLKAGITYTVNNSLILTDVSSVNRITLQSSTTTHAYFNLTAGASQNVTNTNATWIDSSGGITIQSSLGTLSNTINWSLGQGSWWAMFNNQN